MFYFVVWFDIRIKLIVDYFEVIVIEKIREYVRVSFVEKINFMGVLLFVGGFFGRVLLLVG